MKKSQWMALFIIVIMASSTVGFIFSFKEPSNTQGGSVKYKGQEFLTTPDGRWVTSINDVQFVFDNSPEQLDAEIPAFNFGSKVYIISDPNEEDPYLSYNMQKLAYTLQSTSRAVVDACDREEGCPEQTPIKNCVEDAVYLKVSEENKIYKEDKCVVIEGDKEGMAKAVDKLNLGLVGLR